MDAAKAVLRREFITTNAHIIKSDLKSMTLCANLKIFFKKTASYTLKIRMHMKNLEQIIQVESRKTTKKTNET